jgi:hypothetical protein
VRPVADIRVLQDVQAFRIGRHAAVLDAVVDHLDEMPGAGWPTMQVAVLGGAADLIAPGGARRRFDFGRQRCEHRVQVPDRPIRPADHLAKAALEPPDAAAGADVDVVDPFRLQAPGALDVVPVIGVAAVDDDVPGLQQRRELLQGRVDHRRRDHHPGGARLLQLTDQIRHRRGADRALIGESPHRVCAKVEYHALVTVPHQTPHHVGPHPTEANHPELHNPSPLRRADATMLRARIGHPHKPYCTSSSRATRTIRRPLSLSAR